MGVALAIGTYNSCCVPVAALLAAADTVIAYITHDNQPNVSSASSQKNRWINMVACDLQISLKNTSNVTGQRKTWIPTHVLK